MTYPHHHYDSSPPDPGSYGQYQGYPDGGYIPPGYPPPGHPPYGAYQQPGYGGITPQELSDAATANYLGLACLLSPAFGWIGALVYRNNAGERSQFVRSSATNALNFHLSILVYLVAGFIGMCAVSVILGVLTPDGVGFLVWFLVVPLVLGLLIWQIVASCVGAAHANRGEVFRYPGAIRMVKN
ncbi:DUF4870 domain-containing protein [Stackebrandtia albiflava]|uniref:DUF4870 domain-containing protein n=1 Tax=Stackebrandtia albiflava TaxID=406432 RepID=UPI0013155BCA|nr:DUF4870 domain-containing protein [Stackebrandtia albiflava]